MSERRRDETFAAAVFSALLSACSGGAVLVDAAVVANDAARPIEWPELAVGATVDATDPTRIGDDAHAPDLSCIGAWDFPAPGPERPIMAFVGYNLRIATPRSGVCARGYPDGMVTAAAGCTATDPISAADGWVALTALGEAPLSVRLFPSTGATPTASTRGLIGVRLLPSDLPTIPSLDEGTAGLVFSVLQRHEATGSAILFVGATDCAGEWLYGARMRVARADGTYVEDGTGATDPLTWYAAGSNLPSRTQPWTHVYGIASMINVPVQAEDEEVFVELWGRLPGATEPSLVSCGLVPIEPAVISGGPTRPRRTSGPRCPGLSLSH